VHRRGARHADQSGVRGEPRAGLTPGLLASLAQKRLVWEQSVARERGVLTAGEIMNFAVAAHARRAWCFFARWLGSGALVARSARRGAIVAFAALAACSGSAPHQEEYSSPASTVSGTVIERVDAMPYSYIRLKTGQGEVWVAAPMTTVGRDAKVTLSRGAVLKNFGPPGLGRRFDAVLFGTLEAR
jgi:hypothetical protein